MKAEVLLPKRRATYICGDETARSFYLKFEISSTRRGQRGELSNVLMRFRKPATIPARSADASQIEASHRRGYRSGGPHGGRGDVLQGTRGAIIADSRGVVPRRGSHHHVSTDRPGSAGLQAPSRLPPHARQHSTIGCRHVCLVYSIEQTQVSCRSCCGASALFPDTDRPVRPRSLLENNGHVPNQVFPGRFPQRQQPPLGPTVQASKALEHPQPSALPNRFIPCMARCFLFWWMLNDSPPSSTVRMGVCSWAWSCGA